MKKFFTLILLAAAAVAMNAATVTKTGSYKIVFCGNDSTMPDAPAIQGTYSGQAGPNFKSASVLSEGADYVDTAVVAKVYVAAHDFGVKFGTSSATGSLLINLTEQGQVKATKITAVGSAYNTDAKANRFAKFALGTDTCTTIFNDTVTAETTAYLDTASWELDGSVITSINLYQVPCGTAKKGYRVNLKEIVVDYVYEEEVAEANFTADPAAGSVVEKLSKITLTFTDSKEAVDYDYNKQSAATITNDATGESATSMTMLSWGVNMNQLVLDCVPVTADGNYTVTIPAGTILIDNVTYELPIVLKYTVGKTTGINDINVNSNLNGVRVNLNGQRVSDNYQGVVIVNGQKMIQK